VGLHVIAANVEGVLPEHCLEAAAEPVLLGERGEPIPAIPEVELMLRRGEAEPVFFLEPKQNLLARDRLAEEEVDVTGM